MVLIYLMASFIVGANMVNMCNSGKFTNGDIIYPDMVQTDTLMVTDAKELNRRLMRYEGSDLSIQEALSGTTKAVGDFKAEYCIELINYRGDVRIQSDNLDTIVRIEYLEQTIINDNL